MIFDASFPGDGCSKQFFGQEVVEIPLHGTQRATVFVTQHAAGERWRQIKAAVPCGPCLVVFKDPEVVVLAKGANKPVVNENV
jgi:hypothetical protein